VGLKLHCALRSHPSKNTPFHVRMEAAICHVPCILGKRTGLTDYLKKTLGMGNVTPSGGAWVDSISSQEYISC